MLGDEEAIAMAVSSSVIRSGGCLGRVAAEAGREMGRCFLHPAVVELPVLTCSLLAELHQHRV